MPNVRYPWPTFLLILAAWAVPLAAFAATPQSQPAAQSGDIGRPASAPVQPWFLKAPPLPLPGQPGEVVNVKDVDGLFKAVSQARPGATILLADGVYAMPRTLIIRTDNVTLRGGSGQRDRVVLDCAKSQDHEGIGITGCCGVTIADLTLQNVRQNGYKINSDSGVDRVRLYNCVGHNIWQRQVKGVPGRATTGLEDGPAHKIGAGPEGAAGPAHRVGSKDCRVQYCLFYNDRAKRLDDEPYERDHPDQFHGDYIGGIDSMNVRNWTISDNVFIGIHGKNGEARGAIFLWNDSRGATIERNVIIDCDCGICLGNSFRAPEWQKFPHCAGFLVANNFITRCPESNIVAVYTKDCRIVFNTVHDPHGRMGRLLRVVGDNDGLLAACNIFSGPRLAIDAYEGKIDVRDNLVRAVPEYFIDPAKGNLHLTAKAADAIGKAGPMKEVGKDIDGQDRGEKPDLGAAQFVPGR